MERRIPARRPVQSRTRAVDLPVVSGSEPENDQGKAACFMFIRTSSNTSRDLRTQHSPQTPSANSLLPPRPLDHDYIDARGRARKPRITVSRHRIGCAHGQCGGAAAAPRRPRAAPLHSASRRARLPGYESTPHTQVALHMRFSLLSISLSRTQDGPHSIRCHRNPPPPDSSAVGAPPRLRARHLSRRRK